MKQRSTPRRKTPRSVTKKGAIKRAIQGVTPQYKSTTSLLRKMK